MPQIVSFASGKGGVGKSVVVSNVGLALAARGRRVVLADLDVGGGNLATLFGAFESGPDLDQFFFRDVDTLEEVARPVRRNLRLIVGAGETLATANPNWSMKQRLLRQIRRLDADVVLVDVGAGASNHALDFWNAADLQVLVTLPEPTASVDAYRFLKLATVRRSTTRISTRNPERRQIERRDFERAEEVWQATPLAGRRDEGVVSGCAGGAPFVVMNQSSEQRRHFERLQLVSRRFLGQDLRLLTEVPRDPAIPESVLGFLPVVESQADAPAALAFNEIGRQLDEELTRHAMRAAAAEAERTLPDLADLPSAPAHTTR